MAQTVKNPSAMQETWIRSLCGEDFLEKGMATPVFWPGEFHGQRSWPAAARGFAESETTEQLTLSLSLRSLRFRLCISDQTTSKVMCFSQGTFKLRQDKI